MPPQRTSKTNQKLVIFPTSSPSLESALDSADSDVQIIPSPVMLVSIPQPTSASDKTTAPLVPTAKAAHLPIEDRARTEAERTPKDRRFGIPRVTCFCAAQSYDLKAIKRYLVERHRVQPLLYDECMYVVYEHGGNRSITRERQGSRIGLLTNRNPSKSSSSPTLPRSLSFSSSASTTAANSPPGGVSHRSAANSILADIMNDDTATETTATGRRGSLQSVFEEVDRHRDGDLWMSRNEVFIFEYGVIVLWNFTEEEEISYLSTIKSFASNPRSLNDIQIEDFHFQYDLSANQPRIYNDMITLKSSNALIKLTISHAIAQSAKLAHFENLMEEEVVLASQLPKRMARFGDVQLKRDDVIKVVGRLYRLRVDVNLISNVLDKPEIFWSEPELEGLYNAIRGYLEISQRVKLLNNRAGVINDALDMLMGHLNSNEHSFMTWIVIALIVVTCVVASGEVYVKFLMVSAGMEG